MRRHRIREWCLLIPIAVAYVSSIGLLTAVAPGSVEVSGFCGEAVGTITITVNPTPIQIQLDQPTATVGDGTRSWRNVPTPLTGGSAFKDVSVSGSLSHIMVGLRVARSMARATTDSVS